MGYCQLTEGTGKKLQVNFTMKDLSFNIHCYSTIYAYSDISINCTLWEEYAGRFIKFNTDRKDSGPLIVMLAYCKIKEEGRFPLSVSNTYSYTKLFINADIPEINQFRASLPKYEQVQSQSQLTCTQSLSGTQYTSEEDLLSNNTSSVSMAFQIVSKTIPNCCFILNDNQQITRSKS
ncbi:hypothetical protein MTR_1g054840 [Medicago truncatula]|uniref:Uncharacterized protein n=1 Tax=Medicago truncatula TaxID=3880 RepID=A0A072VJM4_MEDTR|nr:hypothetical protein MTR_1g054840 [Medicago truncatula]